MSAYALIVEPGTRLASRIGRGELPMPDDDVAADRYLMAEETLSRTEANLTHHLIAAAAAAHRETLVAVDRLGERRLVILAGLRAAGLPAPPRHPR